MGSTSILDDLTAELGLWRFLEECLLHDMHFIKFGFGVELIFNYVWDEDGSSVRRDVLESPIFLALRLFGVESLLFKGSLTHGMKTRPDLIDWGLSEVACVRPFEDAGQLSLSVQWEGDRRIDIEFMSFELLPPEIPTESRDSATSD